MEPEHPSTPEFVLKCVNACMSVGFDIIHAVWLTGNTCQETGWGRFHRGNNLGGVKINKALANDLSWWWRAAGHVNSGDAPVCYYMVFASYEAFFTFVSKRFVPVPGTAPKSRYRKTGEEFHAYRPWHDDLIAAGYKGEVTRANPDKSIAALENVEERVENYVAQDALKRLGLYGGKVDGKFGPLSRAALHTFQKSQGLPETDDPELLDLWTMYHPGKAFPEALRPKKTETAPTTPATEAPTTPPAPVVEQPKEETKEPPAPPAPEGEAKPVTDRRSKAR